MTERKIQNLNRLLLSEVLQLINEDPSLMAKGKPFAFTPNSALHKVFYYAYMPDAKFKLPEGVPPYTPSRLQPGLDSTDLLIAIRRGRFGYMVDGGIPNVRREQLFISLLETVNEAEAKVLLAIKDQCLDKMYPNLTYKVLSEYGYLPYDEKRCTDDTKSADVVEKDSEKAEPVSANTRKTASKATRSTKSTARKTTTKRVAVHKE